ncbi:MAG TPA: MFS transporter [Actinomycetota bacterium]|nr:MFS transporter [Actinomycetota bacterium]
MLGLLGVVRPRWPHPPLRRSRQAVLDILCNIFAIDVFPIIGAHFVGMSTLVLVIGDLVDRIGQARSLATGLLGMGLSVSALLGVESVHATAAALFGLGLGWNLAFVAATAQLTDQTEPSERGRLLGFNDLLSGTTGAGLTLLGGFALTAAGVAAVAIGAVALVVAPGGVDPARQRRGVTPGRRAGDGLWDEEESMMAEQMIQANGVDLCAESFGNPADPPVLLVMGTGGSMLWWEEGFCRMLADGGRFVTAAEVDWSDARSVIEYQVDYARVLAGGRRPFDETGARELARRDVQRAHNFAAAQNHDAIADDGRSRGPLSPIDVPTLVIHGTADPMFPFEHGEAVAREIPGARLLTLEGAGHGLDRADWEPVARAIIEHTTDAERTSRRKEHRPCW